MQRKCPEHSKKLALVEKLQLSKHLTFPAFDQFGKFMRFSAAPIYPSQLECSGDVEAQMNVSIEEVIGAFPDKSFFQHGCSIG